jgi:hypothetical protein
MRCLLGWRASPEGRHRDWRRSAGGVEAVMRSRPGAAGRVPQTTGSSACAHSGAQRAAAQSSMSSTDGQDEQIIGRALATWETAPTVGSVPKLAAVRIP